MYFWVHAFLPKRGMLLPQNLATEKLKTDPFFNHMIVNSESISQLRGRLTGLHSVPAFYRPLTCPRKLQPEQCRSERGCVCTGETYCFTESWGVLTACLAGGPVGEGPNFFEACWLRSFAIHLIVAWFVPEGTCFVCVWLWLMLVLGPFLKH